MLMEKLIFLNFFFRLVCIHNHFYFNVTTFHLIIINIEACLQLSLRDSFCRKPIKHAVAYVFALVKVDDTDDNGGNSHQFVALPMARVRVIAA